MAGLDHVQRLLPDGGGPWVGNRGGHRVDQGEGSFRGTDGAALLHEVAPRQQAGDDVGARGFGADARRVLQLLLQARVGHEARNALH
ncbi:hypothetical protein SDC9_71531 [bioreactor metagenome]|uniref:Uncharacterized protein n=1 Tax=bioreactor metagenome TaxID=1076179 RepID=A0A644Y8T8_9ZZZZ